MEDDDERETIAENVSNKTLLRVYQAAAGLTVSIWLTMMAWMISEILVNRDFLVSGNRYTMENAIADRVVIDQRFAALPPPETRRRIELLE